MSWTKEEEFEFNKKCATFCGLTNLNDDSFPEYIDKLGNFYSMNDLLFHSDWNRIHEVALHLKDTPNPKENSDTTFTTLRRDVQYRIGVSDKESAVDAINKFLIWYNENN